MDQDEESKSDETILEEHLQQDESLKPEECMGCNMCLKKGWVSETFKTGLTLQQCKIENQLSQDIDSLEDDMNSYCSLDCHNDLLSGWKNSERPIGHGQVQEISRIEVPFYKVNADHIHKIFCTTHLKLTKNLAQSKIEEINNKKRYALAFSEITLG